MRKKYSFKKGFGKMLVQVAIIGLPLALQLFPSDVLNLTIGGAANLLLNWLKVKYQ